MVLTEKNIIFQGYELEGILGRRIGSLVCRIVEVSRGTENKLQKLQLEEICIQSRTPILIWTVDITLINTFTLQIACG